MNRCIMMSMVRGMRRAFRGEGFEQRHKGEDESDGQRTLDGDVHDALVMA